MNGCQKPLRVPVSKIFFQPVLQFKNSPPNLTKCKSFQFVFSASCSGSIPLSSIILLLFYPLYHPLFFHSWLTLSVCLPAFLILAFFVLFSFSLQEARDPEGPGSGCPAALPHIRQWGENWHQQDRGVPGGESLPSEVVLLVTLFNFLLFLCLCDSCRLFPNIQYSGSGSFSELFTVSKDKSLQRWIIIHLSVVQISSPGCS